MDHLPLTTPAPFEEFPAGDTETLFPCLPPNGLRQVEVTVTLSGREKPVMQIVTSQDSAETAFAMAFSACRQAAGFEICVRPLGERG